jgi:HD-GYP domain-containing protein (c-di-GMP phosphodiesterase class II)
LPSGLETALALAELVDAKQPGPAGHSRVVGRYAEAMGERLGLGPDDVRRLSVAGMLHDVGKIAVPRWILAKPGRLTQEEMEEMRIHPMVGERIADNTGLTDIAGWIGAHHERPDGRGYPNGLTPAEIPIQAQILAVADAYDAMTNDRPYRRAMRSDQAREELLRQAGTQFHRRVVECFLLLDDRVLDAPRRSNGYRATRAQGTVR